MARASTQSVSTQSVSRQAKEVVSIPPAEAARIAAGFGGADGLKRLARKLNCQPGYILRWERRGGPPYIFVERAAYHLGCAPDVYDIRPVQRTVRTRKRSTETQQPDKTNDAKKAGGRANGTPAQTNLSKDFAR